MLGIGLDLASSAIRSQGFGSSSAPSYAVNGFEPELVADFKDGFFREAGMSTTLESLLSFSRASAANYTDGTGTIQTAEPDELRAEHHVYEGGQWVNKGVFIESATTTNLIPYSAPHPSGWNTVRASILLDDDVAPNGEIAASKIAENTSNNTHSLSATGLAFEAGTRYALSVYAKAGSRDWICLQGGAAAFGSSIKAWFNLATGELGTVQAGVQEALIEPAGHGYYRCTIIDTAVTTAVASLDLFMCEANGSISYQGDGASYVHVWGSQVEASAYPSSPIETSGSSMTRAEETLTIAAEDLPFSPMEMSMFVSAQVSYVDDDSTSVGFVRWLLDGDDYFTLELDTAAGGSGGAALATSKAGNVSLAAGPTNAFAPGSHVPMRVAARVTSAIAQSASMGSSGLETTLADAPDGLPDLSNAVLDLGVGFQGTINRFVMWGADIQAAGLEEATA